MSIFGKSDRGEPEVDRPQPGGGTAAKPTPVTTSGPRPVSPPTAPSSSATDMSIVSRGLTIEGNLRGDDDIRVDGTVNGDISSRTLIVSQGAKVSGKVTAEMIELLGHIDGELNGKTVRIAGTGHLDGDVNYEQLSIEAGAVVNGQLRHGSGKQAARGAGAGAAGVSAKPGNGAAKPEEPKADGKDDAKGDSKPDAKSANA